MVADDRDAIVRLHRDRVSEAPGVASPCQAQGALLEEIAHDPGGRGRGLSGVVDDVALQGREFAEVLVQGADRAALRQRPT